MSVVDVDKFQHVFRNQHFTHEIKICVWITDLMRQTLCSIINIKEQAKKDIDLWMKSTACRVFDPYNLKR